MSQARSTSKEIEGAQLDKEQEIQLKEDKKERVCKKNFLPSPKGHVWNKGKTLSIENKVSFISFSHFYAT